MASQADVCNIACAILGVSPVTTIADTTLQALTFNSIWNLERDSELRKRVWKFSVTRGLISNLFNGTLGAVVNGNNVGYSSGNYGTLSPSADLNGNGIPLLVDNATVGTFTVSIVNILPNTTLAQNYFDQISLQGGQVNATLDTDNAAFSYASGTGTWVWTGSLGLTATSYAVRLDSSSTNLTQPVTGPYQFAYPLPSGTLRVLQVGNSDFSFPGGDLSDYRSLPTENDYVIESGNILTNYPSPASIRYVQQVTSVPLWDPTFCEAMGARLAHRACFRVTQSLNQQKMAQQEYTMAIQAAQRSNALESAPQYIADDSWVLARPVGAGGAPTTRLG